MQTYTPGPPLVPGIWFEYEIVVQGDDYTVFLTNTQTGERTQTTFFHNTDAERGRSPGFIGVQAYPGNTSRGGTSGSNHRQCCKRHCKKGSGP